MQKIIDFYLQLYCAASQLLGSQGPQQVTAVVHLNPVKDEHHYRNSDADEDLQSVFKYPFERILHSRHSFKNLSICYLLQFQSCLALSIFPCTYQQCRIFGILLYNLLLIEAVEYFGYGKAIKKSNPISLIQLLGLLAKKI